MRALCKNYFEPKDWVTTEDNNNTVYEIDCSNCKTVYLSKSKLSLKTRLTEHKRSARTCDYEKNEVGKHCRERSHNF